MRIKKVFNNNVVLAYKDETEVVIFGKGVGFQKQHGDKLNKSLIEKMFTLTEKQTNHFESLFRDVSTEYADLTFTIVKQAESDLQIEFNSNIYIAILDHINYALIRAKKEVFVKNVLLWEIQRTYKKEYEAALKTLAIIKDETGIELPVDEAGTIAIHYYNAQDPRLINRSNYKAVQIIQDIVKIIQYHFRIELDENDMNYNRLMTHLRYFINSLLSDESKTYNDGENFMFKQMIRQYPDVYECVLKIIKYLSEKGYTNVANEEQLYLMIHIQRIVEKEKSK